MTHLQAINLTLNTVIVEHLDIADTAMTRMKGLLGRSALADDAGLLITRCNSIHMFFMRFPIDVVFLDRKDKVVGLVRNIPPFFLSPVFWKATQALELTAGKIDRIGIRLGHQVGFSSGSSK